MTPFDRELEKYHSDKEDINYNLDKEKEFYAKLMLNSLYGKFATGLIVQEKIPYVENGEVHYKLGEKEQKAGVYLPMGAFITAYARDKTIRTSQAIKTYSINKYGEDLYYYSDTDSIHTGLPIEELKQFCEIDDVELGKWKHESHFTKARFVRQKTYLEEIDGEMKSKKVETTVGRVIYNQGIPQDLGFVDRTDPEKAFDLEISFPVIKKNLGKIVAKCIEKHGLSEAAEVLDYIKATGFKYSTKGAITVSAADVTSPKEKWDILAEADKKVEDIAKKYKRGLITNEERYTETIKVWDAATKEVTKAMEANFDDMNPIFMMAKSGARGNINQLRQIAGMRGLMADTQGKAVEIPIKANFREGLDPLEYFISSHGGRKGLADTALRTADSGYLTRRLVDVSQDIIVKDEDCGCVSGLVVKDLINDKDGSVVEPLAERLVGRFTSKKVIHPETKEVIVDKDILLMR